MQKAEAHHNQVQSLFSTRQRQGGALESPQGERIAQFQAMVKNSPQVQRLSQLAAMANNSRTGETARREEGEESPQAETAQRAEAPAKPNHTGLPDTLKGGIESLSGISMDNVRVHYNSSQPAQLNALAYAQGTDIHVAPGQEQHLPHEAWHVVQQAQGRVKPTMQMKGGVPVNDDKGLEHEAGVIGAQAAQMGPGQGARPSALITRSCCGAIQLLPKLPNENEAIIYFEDELLDVIDEKLGVVFELRQLAISKGWEDLSERIDYYLLTSKRFVRMKLNALDMTSQSNLKIMLKYLEIAQDQGWDDVEETLLAPIRRLEDIRDGFIDPNNPRTHRDELPSDSKEKPDNPKHSEKLNESNKLGLADAFLAMAKHSGKPKKDAESLVPLLNAAHASVPTDFSADQEAYQKALQQDLGLSKEQIMDFHRSSGYEFEFASFAIPGKELKEDEEIMPSHIELGASSVFSNLFNLPYKLETDSANSLEIATPPYLFLISADSRGVMGKVFDMIKKQTEDLEKTISTPKDSMLNTKGGDFNQSGLGTNWTFTGAAKGLTATLNMKHKQGAYGQVNVSMTAQEIGRFMDVLRQEQSSLGVSVMSDKSLTTMLLKNIFKDLFSKYQPKQGPDPTVQQALTIYSRYAANLLAIPSIMMRQDFRDYEHKPEPNYATEVKESFGLWIKDNPHSVLGQFMNGMTPEGAKEFSEIIMQNQSNVENEIFIALDSRKGEVKNWLEKMKQGQADSAIKTETTRVMQIADLKARQAEVPKLLVFKKTQIEKAKKEAEEAFVKWEVEYRKAVSSELNAMNQLISGAKKLSLGWKSGYKMDFLNERFGKGLGVRKDTYLNPVSTSERTLRVGEIRGKQELDKFEEL